MILVDSGTFMMDDTVGKTNHSSNQLWSYRNREHS